MKSMTLSDVKRILGAETTKSLLLCSTEGRRLLAASRMARGTPEEEEANANVKDYVKSIRAKVEKFQKPEE